MQEAIQAVRYANRRFYIPGEGRRTTQRELLRHHLNGLVVRVQCHRTKRDISGETLLKAAWEAYGPHVSPEGAFRLIKELFHG